eukprot:6738223-Alexandrium_andersonii.AAC.1
MSASLVGSEMCIRDRPRPPQPPQTAGGAGGPPAEEWDHTTLADHVSRMQGKDRRLRDAWVQHCRREA